jgi:hypothetical protein
MKTLGIISYTGIVIIINTLFGGYTFMKVWQWLVMYAFNIHSLNLIQSIGIVFFWNFLSFKIKDSKKNEKSYIDRLTYSFIGQIIFCCFTLLIAWLITLFQ